MRLRLSLVLLSAALGQAKVVRVGPTLDYPTVAAAVQAHLPLQENLYVEVYSPTVLMTTPDQGMLTHQWNGFRVIVQGKTGEPVAPPPGGSMWFHHDGVALDITSYVEDEAVYELEPSTPAMEEAYVNVKGLQGVEGRLEGDVMTYYAKDHLGSTRVAVNVSTRQRSEVSRYSSFGHLQQFMASAVQAKQKFTGKELDGENGLYYFGARYYDPDLGMWISPDPAREFHSPYTYVGNNPVNNLDPDGKESQSLESALRLAVNVPETDFGIPEDYDGREARAGQEDALGWAAFAVGLVSWELAIPLAAGNLMISTQRAELKEKTWGSYFRDISLGLFGKAWTGTIETLSKGVEKSSKLVIDAHNKSVDAMMEHVGNIAEQAPPKN